MSDVTRLRCAIQHGEPSASNELLTLVYGELRRLAAAKMAREEREDKNALHAFRRALIRLA